METESLECRVFRMKYEKLQTVTRHALGNAVQAAYSSGLIPEDIRNVAGDAASAMSQDSRTRTFLNAVHDGIKMDPKKVYKFIEILQQDQFTKTVADQLTEALQTEPEIMARELQEMREQQQLILNSQFTQNVGIGSHNYQLNALVSPPQSRPAALSNLPGDRLLMPSGSLTSLLVNTSRTPVQHPTALKIRTSSVENTALLSLTSTYRGPSYSGPAHYAASITSPPMRFDGSIKGREMSPMAFVSSEGRKTSLQSASSLPPSRNHSGVLTMHPLHPESISSEFVPYTLLTNEQPPHSQQQANCSIKSQEAQQINKVVTRLSTEYDSSGKHISDSEDHGNVSSSEDHGNVSSSEDHGNVSDSAPSEPDSGCQTVNKLECFSDKAVEGVIQDFEAVKLHGECDPSNLQGHFVPDNPQSTEPKTNYTATALVKSDTSMINEGTASTSDSDSEQINVDVQNPIPPRQRIKSTFSQDSVESSISSIYETPLSSLVDDCDDHVNPIQESHDSVVDDNHRRTKLTTESGAFSVRNRGSKHQSCTKCVKYKQEIKVLYDTMSTLKRSLSQSADIQEHQVAEYNKRLFVTEQENYALKERVEDQNQRHDKAETEIATLRNQTEHLTTTVVLMNERLEKDQVELQRVKAEAYDYIKHIEFLKRQLEQVNFMQCQEQSSVQSVAQGHGPYSVGQFEH